MVRFCFKIFFIYSNSYFLVVSGSNANNSQGLNNSSLNNSLNSSLDASTSNALSPSSNLPADQKDKNKKSLIFKVIFF